MIKPILSENDPCLNREMRQLLMMGKLWLPLFSISINIGVEVYFIEIDTKIGVIAVLTNGKPITVGPRTVVSFLCRWRHYNDRNRGISFYSIMMKPNLWQINKFCQSKCSKLSPNWLSHSMVTCAQLAIVPWEPDCFSLVTRVTSNVMSQQCLFY